MKFLRGLLASLLSLILFAALSGLGTAFMLNQTVMDPNFTASQIDKLDIAELVGGFVRVPDYGNDVNTFISAATINTALASSIKSAELELKDELRPSLFATYDYFLGRRDSLNIAISLEPVKANMKTELWTELQQNPPAQIGGVPYNTIPKATVESTFNTYFEQSAKNLFPEISVDSSTFDAVTLNTLGEIRRYLSYYSLWWVTIPLILICAVALVLLEGNLRGSLLNLGINLAVFGVLGFAIDYILKYFAGPSTLLPGLPAAAQTWLYRLFDDIMAPLATFSIGVAVIGAVLIIISFFLPKKETAVR